MQQRMHGRTYSKRILKTVWLLAQGSIVTSHRFCPILAASSLWLQELYLIQSLRRSVSYIYIPSFPHLTCDKGLGTTLLYIQVVLVWFFLCIWTSGCLVPRPNYRARPAACSLKGVRKTVWRCKSGARVLFLPVNYVLSWSADLGGPCLTSMTCTCCECMLSC